MNVERVPLPESLTKPHIRLGLFGECNFRCTYCPPWGENSYEVEDNLTLAELMPLLRALSANGFEVVKLTGGEPTLRRDLIEIAEAASRLFREVRLITNAWNLDRIAPDLTEAGVAAVEISLDALDEPVFDAVTKSRGKLPKVLAGLSRCLDLGFNVQLNMVVMRANCEQVGPMIDFIEDRGRILLKLLELVYYEFPGRRFWLDNFIPMKHILPLVERRAIGSDWLSPPGSFGTPMRIFHLSNESSVIVKDGSFGAVYADICENCPLFPCQDGLYGLSLTVDGIFKMCKHRPDLNVRAKKTAGIPSSSSADQIVGEVAARYKSAYYLADGWNHERARASQPDPIVPPTQNTLRWYRH